MIKIILILLILLIIPNVKAQIECDVSDDNETWVDITSTLYDGCIDENSSLANINNLDEDQTYYLRCKDDETEWNYVSTRTDPARESDLYFVYVLILSVLLILLWTGYYTDDYVFLVLSGLLSLTIAVYLFNNEFLNLTNTLLRNGLVVLFIGYGAFYTIAPTIRLVEEYI